MPKDSTSGLLATLRPLFVTIRVATLLVGAVAVLAFAFDFVLEMFFVSSSPIYRSAIGKFVNSITGPVVAFITSGLRVNTRVQGHETMPLIVAAVLFALTAIVSSQVKSLVDWIDAERHAREMERLRAQRKGSRDVDFSSQRKQSTISRLLGVQHTQQEELMRAKQELDKFRKKLAFLSIDVVGSTRMKVGRDPLLTERLFRSYRQLLEGILKQHRHKTSSWTPDGIMACFLQPEVACNAAKTLLRALPEFNRTKNPLDVPVEVRCGVHFGELLFDEKTPLELLSDRVLDITGHLQKNAAPNTLLVSGVVFDQIRDKSAFFQLKDDVDGYAAFEWTVDGVPVAAAAPKAAAAAAGVGSSDATLVPGLSGGAGAGALPGRIGRYEVISELGRGAMGVVYKAKDPQIGRTVAIKMILTGNVPPQHLAAYKKRFFREAQTAGLLSHPGIVTIYDIAEHESGQLYLVMEFVEGTTLEKLLTPGKPDDTLSPVAMAKTLELGANGSGSDPITLEKKLDIVIQVCDALDCAHTQGVIHRDIKPANILYTLQGRAKLADFGIAKLEGSSLTQTGTIMGTPAFMSPEQFTGGGVDQRSDLFSLGAVLYWMVTGQAPFPGDTVTEVMFKLLHTEPVSARELNASLPDDIDTVLRRCLAKRAEDRYTTAGSLAEELRAILSRTA